MSAAVPPAATRRADAERNRGRILAAAHAAFADPGAEVSRAEVSRRAEVGMATLYRNFSNRRELLEAVFADEVDAICAAATGTGATGDAGEALLTWLHQLFTFFAGRRRIVTALLEHRDGDDPLFGRSRSRVLEAGRPLLEAAQQAKQVPDHLTFDQVLDLVHAIAAIDATTDHVGPIPEVALRQLRRDVC